MTEDPIKEETFHYIISRLNIMLEEIKKDIDEISEKFTNDDDQPNIREMINAYEKVCQTAKILDEEIYVLGSIMNDYM
jgi:Mg2+ and Co2+ transporter CorA